MPPLVSLPEILPDLQVRHTERHPLFVLGAGRSGTSLMCALLMKYLKVNFGTESQFILDYHRRLSLYGSLSDDANLRHLVSDIAAERCFARWQRRFGFSLDRGRVFADLRERTLRGILLAIFEQYAQFHGMERWGDKSPTYDAGLPVLLDLFPDARFLHVLRDGRDVALSNFRIHFGARNAYKAAVGWRTHVVTVRAFAATLPPGRFLEVRYEDLMARPLVGFAQLIDFLRIDDRSGDLLQFIGAHVHQDLRDGNTQKWRKEFTLRDHEVFEAVAGDVLASAGYERLSRRQVRLGPLSRAYFEVDNKCRKWVDPAYQKDNLYKIGLRVQRGRQVVRRAAALALGSGSASRGI